MSQMNQKVMNCMKIIRITKSSILKPVALLGIFLLLSGCLQELNEDSNNVPGSSETVILSIANIENNPGETRANDVNDDKGQINSICVVQLDASDSWRTVKQISEGLPIDGSPGQFKVELLASTGGEKWNILVLSNVGDIEALKTKWLNKPYPKGSLTIDTTPQITDARAWTMFGMAYLDGSSDIYITKYMGALSIRLLRSVAKVDIGIGYYDANSNTWEGSTEKIPFRLTEIQVRRTNNRIVTNPDIGNAAFDPMIPAVKKANISTDPPTGSNPRPWLYPMPAPRGVFTEDYCKNLIYLPEAALSGARYDADHLNRPAIIIGGIYGTDTQPTWYRIDFCGLGGGRDLFDADLLRNHLYRISITEVNGPGQTSPDLADQTIPENLSFTTSVEKWVDGQTASPPQRLGYYMIYGGLNGQRISARIVDGTQDREYIITQKTATWQGRWNGITRPAFDYNTFYGEAENLYARFEDPGKHNGDLYYRAFGYPDNGSYRYVALVTEGVHPRLMIAADDIIDTNGTDTFQWKTGTKLTAFDMCRAYNGGGYSDWRLPRLSELALMHLNKEELNKLTGFSPLKVGEYYWSGSEYGEGQQTGSDMAWQVQILDPAPNGTYSVEPFKPYFKNVPHRIRCVRQP